MSHPHAYDPGHHDSYNVGHRDWHDPGHHDSYNVGHRDWHDPGHHYNIGFDAGMKYMQGMTGMRYDQGHIHHPKSSDGRSTEEARERDRMTAESERRDISGRFASQDPGHMTYGSYGTYGTYGTQSSPRSRSRVVSQEGGRIFI
jgi:hypothetical protein